MSIKEEVYRILQDISCREDIEVSDDLKKDLGFDSLSMITLLIELEDALRVELEESDMDPVALITVQDVVELAERYGLDIDEKES